MGYYDYLRALLEPLGAYDLLEGAGAAELRLLGDELDGVFQSLEELGRELLPLTASAYGLEIYEKLLRTPPAYITEEDRRRAVTALLRIRNGCFTQKMLSDNLAGCGINAEVSESGEPMTIQVSFPDNMGIPEGMDSLRERIESILPCHLAIKYAFNYSSWERIMARLPTWGDMERSCGSWRELEILL